jgi:hypothetical protein
VGQLRKIAENGSASRRQGLRSVDLAVLNLRSMTLREKRSNPAADLRAFYPPPLTEAAFRENVWQSGARNRMPKNG